MERRDFIKNSGVACGILSMPGFLTQSIFARPLYENELFHIPRPLDTRLNVKPLFGIRVPAELHEGPCRPNDPSGWDRKEAGIRAKETYHRWADQLTGELKENVNILDPVYVEYAGDHRIGRETWDRITANDRDTDLYVLSHYRIPGLGDHTDQPIVLVGNACATLDVPAILNARGKTAYGVLNYDELKELIACLKVKKALKHTKLLIVTDGKWDYEYNVVRSNIDTELLEKKFGTGSHYLSIEEMMKEYEQVRQEKKYVHEAEVITKTLMQKAEKNTMQAEGIKPSVLYYFTVKKLMEKHGCNGFTATCQELCVSKFPMKYRTTPCITHSLLKDEGYPSVCEADVNVFFSMALQMYLANRTPYMGNTLIHDPDRNLLQIGHDVPGRKMKGFDQPDLPFRLVSFTERNWGPTMRVDFSRDKGQPVTFCRMTPKADKVLVVKGILEGVGGLEDWGCKLKAILKVSDSLKYFKSAQQTGHHFSMIYGDFTREMKRLAEILNIEIELLV